MDACTLKKCLTIICLTLVCFLSSLLSEAQEKPGATIPWTTYEAERCTTNGTVLSPKYQPYLVETESSGQQCVQLNASGQYIQLIAEADANSMVIRYSLPDRKEGNGTSATLGIYKNGELIQRYLITSRYAWLYGKYPFTNDPAAGSPRHFYDELRIKGLAIAKGDSIRIQRDDLVKQDDLVKESELGKQGNASYCIIDLVDLEEIAPPLQQPENALSIADKSFQGNELPDDYTTAFRNCIAKAIETGKSVWIPAGTFKIAGDLVLPGNLTIQGAGMWYSELVGDETQYASADRRVRLKGNGSNIHLSDFAITGKLNYRSDKESNDGIVGSYGTGSTISRIWIEHTKVGMWIENSQRLQITGCRMRNTMADGINFCVGMSHSTIANCTARGTGDDCFAIWPTTFLKQFFSPGNNRIMHCTGQLPYLANGAAVYGGESNSISHCSFSDITQGSAILVSTTFPTESKDKSINNNFSGTTVIEDCDITTSGGFDHEWDWRAAVEICLDRRSIAGLEINNLHIDSSLSNGLSVIAKNAGDQIGTLSNATLQNLTITHSGIGTANRHDLFISNGAHGSLIIKNSNIRDIDNGSGGFSIMH